MPIGVTKVTDASYVAGNKRFRVYDVAFSGTYTANGESVTAAQVGLKKIQQVHAPGAALDSTSAPALGNPLGVVISSTGSTATFVLLESAADGDALDEKPAETTASAAATFRVTFIGY
jgi:hypothetical protein